MQWLSALIVCSAAILPSLAVAQSPENLETQRKLYLQAERTAHSSTTYRELRTKLGDYPLVAYLDYSALARRLGSAKADEIHEYLRRYPDSMLAERLQESWLNLLAARNKGADLVANYRPTDNVALDCRYRQALLAQGQHAEAFADLDKHWLVGKLQPETCAPVFDAWRKSGGLSTALIWDRIELAIKAGNTRLATSIAQWLPAAERPWVDVWIKVARDPSLVESRKLFKGDAAVRTRILSHGIVRLAYRNVNEGMSVWGDLKTVYPFQAEERAQVQRTLTLLLAQGRNAAAPTWLTSIEPDAETPRIREWRVRNAIEHSDWVGTLTAIDLLTDEEKADPRWQYWRARSLEMLGYSADAQALYAALANIRHYHGFLAADRVDRTYELENKPAEFSAEELAAVERIPAIARARELYALNRITEASREWEHVSHQLDPDTLIRAAKLAQNWGWHSRAIFTAAQSGYWHDLEMRFPVVYEKTVVDRAQEFKIEAAWVYGILRQESAFVADARSPRGALGLMQLLPSTAKYIAVQNKSSLKNAKELLVPEKNIQLGSAYLHHVRKRLYDNPVLATAAYNAGEGRVKTWLPKTQELPADVWIETIPYDETRDYVERVLAYTVIYDWQLTGKPKSLKHFMLPVIDQNAILTKTQDAKPGGAG